MRQYSNGRDGRLPAVRLRLRPVWLAAGWLLVVAIVYLSLSPAPPELPLDGGDKYGHVLAYGAAMLWFGQLYDGGRRTAAALALAALGVALEFAQEWTGYRAFELADMAADAAGVLVGLALSPPRLPNLLAACERWAGLPEMPP